MPVGVFDPRVQGGVGCVARKELSIFMNAPVVIFLAGNDRMVSPEQHAGICGQNMNMAAKSLDLGFCWTGFGARVELIPKLKAKLGLEKPWRIQAAMGLGYPKFNQEGLVPRQFRPVTWFRPGRDGPEVKG